MVANNRTTHPRERACQPIHAIYLQYMAVIKDSQIFVHTPLEIYSHVEMRDTILYEGALSSTVMCLSYYWDKKERKRLRNIM